MNESNLIKFANGVIREMYEDLQKFDTETEDAIKKSIIFYTRCWLKRTNKDETVTDYANGVMQEIYKDIDDLTEDEVEVMTNALVYRMRRWLRRNERVSTEAMTYDKKAVAFEMFYQGMPIDEIQGFLQVSGFTLYNYRRDWLKAQQQEEVKSESWYRQEYPGLHDGLYQALASGKVSETIIRRNAW